jgi:Caspase domain/N-acetylmuramoyl-L-alanine amidase
MPNPFHQITVEQFADLLAKFPFTRFIDAVHMHHTWRPDHSQYKGLSTIETMWEFHTKNRGWSDIAQHISIAPDGTIWTGRNWNEPPVSARGFNGSRKAGPFMFETIGDFDIGKDPFDGPQKNTALAVIALVQKRFDLGPGTLRFHNQMSEKSCPGSSLDRLALIDEVDQMRHQIDNAPRAGDGGANIPFDDRAGTIWRVIDSLKNPVPRAPAEVDAEGCDRVRSNEFEFSRSTVAEPEAQRGGQEELPPELIESLRPHVISLNQGHFSLSGRFQTRPADVDAIFEEHLHNWARKREGQKVPIVFYADGGLTSEDAGLITAAAQVEWWKENGAYPIYFVWETALLETLERLLNPNRQRGLEICAPSDFALEELARTIGGVKIWGGMKLSAERSADADGGARFAARKLKEFCDNPEVKDRVELHAIGHSAGSIFHAYFVPSALEEQVPEFKSLNFLAPAIRVDTFERQLFDKVGPGKGVSQLNIFTMARSFEEDDSCVSVYRKSLLYLIYYALEPEPRTPILGLEESIRGNVNLRRLFNLDNKGAGAGEVIWSVSKERSGPSASTSRTHGDFSNDASTMESIAHRIVGQHVTPFTGTGERAGGVLEDLEARTPGLREWMQPQLAPVIGGPATVRSPSPWHPSRSVTGRRRALCVGIDRYPTAPLGGCANDARQWGETLRSLSFENPLLLLDGEATRSAILGNLTELIGSSHPGDVLVFQFAGHGTQLKDLNADEAGGDSPGLDEALCPIDFAEGHFLIDDDLATVFEQVPPGVNMTVFTDCCHSGTITRLAIGTPAAGAGASGKARFIPSTPEMEAAHAAFRESLGTVKDARSRGAYDRAREILFCACRSREVALESAGHGHFTTRATEILNEGIAGLSNAEFQRRVTAAFGANPRQNPELHCAAELRDFALLSSASRENGGGVSESSPGGSALRQEVASILEAAAQAIRG